MTEAQLYDYGLTFSYPASTGARRSVPLPFGGKQRQIHGGSQPGHAVRQAPFPADISTAMGGRIFPSGRHGKIGNFEYQVRINSSPTTIEGLNNLPVRAPMDGGLYQDVAQVRDG